MIKPRHFFYPAGLAAFSLMLLNGAKAEDQVPAAAASDSPKVEVVGAETTQNQAKPHRVTYELPQVEIDGTEMPMHGKYSHLLVLPPLTSDNGGTVWVTRFESEVIDEETGKANGDLLCHTHVTESGPNGYEAGRFFGNQAGSNITELPEGYAVPFHVSKAEPLYLYGMAADYAHSGQHRKVHFSITLDYYDDATAKQLGIKELHIKFISLIPADNKVPKGEPTLHFWAPPGKHEYQDEINDKIPDLKKGDLRVYQIHNHVHPYAKYGEIIDLTAHKTVWRGYAHTYPDKSVLKSVDHYSSTKGFVLKKTHRYQIHMLVDNPTDQPVSSMLTMRLFYRPVHSGKKPRSVASRPSE